VLRLPRVGRCSELHVFLCGLVLVGLKPSDFVDLSLVASAAAPATTSTSATTSSFGVTAPATATPTAAKLSNAVHVGRVLFKVTDEVSKQLQTCREGLFFFPHGQHLADHGLDRIVLDSSQQMTDLGALVKATVAMLHQFLGNGVLLNMGISIAGPVPVLLLAAIGQARKAGFHLVGKMIHVITSKVMGKQEGIQLAAILLLLGQGGMKPRGCLPKNSNNMLYRHHIDAEGVTKWFVLLKQCNGCCRLAWEGNMVLEGRCTSNHLGI
jgi:hypothetical protein